MKAVAEIIAWAFGWRRVKIERRYVRTDSGKLVELPLWDNPSAWVRRK